MQMLSLIYLLREYGKIRGNIPGTVEDNTGCCRFDLNSQGILISTLIQTMQVLRIPIVP